MGRGTFETVLEAQKRAQRALPRPVYLSLMAGSEALTTQADNVAAFSEIGFAPRTLDLPARRDLSTRIMGIDLKLPVIISPVGVQAVHPSGEIALARAAKSRGVALGLSALASKPIEEVVEVGAPTLAQLYWIGGREAMAERVLRAKRAGAVGLILTVDWSWSHHRDWGSPAIPTQLSLKTMLAFAPEAVRRPRWTARWLAAGIPDLTVPNIRSEGVAAAAFWDAYREWRGTPPPTWHDVAWLRDLWGGPFMLKGICRVDEARRAVDAGVTAISVSNHGGNNLDGPPAPIRCLAAIADAVGGDVEVVLDSGIRRGSDIVKAIGLGARGVMLGRSALWGLAAGGETGVERVLDIMRNGMDSAVFALGHQAIGDVKRTDLLVPAGFSRALGAGEQA